MHEVGVSVIWLSLQVTVVAVASTLLYFCVRRQGPLLRSLVISSSMLITLLLAALVFSPWPRWNSEKIEQSKIEESRITTIPEGNGENNRETVVSPTSEAVSINLESVWSSAWGGFLEGLKKEPPVKDQLQSLSWPAVVGFLFLGGMALGLMRLGLGYILLRREVQRSCSLEGTAARDLLDDILIKQTNRPSIRLKETQCLATAAVVGWWRPVILLPDSWRTWSHDQLRAVLTHELAHINQRDFLSNFYAEISRSIHFYHPLMHWLVARLRLEQELAADAAAAKSSGGAEPYLIILAEMAMAQSNRSVRGPARAFLPTQTTFLRRIDMLKTKASLKGTVSRSARAVAVATVMLVGIFAIGIREDRNTIAQEATPAAANVAATEVKNKGPEKFAIDFVPNNALAVIALRPANILSQDSMKPIRTLIEQENRKRNDFNVFGLKPTEIEVVTTIFIPPDLINKRGQSMDHVTVIQVNQSVDLTEEFDRTKILKKFSGGQGKLVKFTNTKIGKETYSKVTSSRNDALLFLSNRMLMIANNEKSLQLVIDAMQSGGVNRWAKQWSEVENASVAGIFDVRVARAIVGDEQAQVAAANAPVLGLISPIWESSNLASFGMTINQNISLKATLYQEKNGEEIKNTLNALVVLANNMLRQMNRSASGNTVQQRLSLMSLINVAQKVLKSVKVTQKNEDVNLTTELPGDSGAQMIALLVPAVIQARTAARRVEGMNNLKQIMLALHNYHDAHKHFPPAVVMGPDGKTPHSWRVELLPYLDHKALYEEYKMDEPWDSENNKKVLAKMPSVFRSPDDDGPPNNTSYFAVVGKNTAFGKISAGAAAGAFGGEGLAGGFGAVGSSKGGVRIRDITDGTSNTVAVVEAKRDIPWTKPEDIKYDGKQLPKFGGFHQGGYYVGLCDGSVRFLSEKINPKTLKNLLQINDGNPLPTISGDR